MDVIAMALWFAFLVAAIFYTHKARHPQARPMAAYLIFVTVFTVSAFVAFATITVILQGLGQAGALSHPVGAALFLLIVFVPAFFLGRWQLRKPPRHVGTP